MFFGSDQYWKTPVTWGPSSKAKDIMMRIASSPWLVGLTFLSYVLFVVSTWEILYGLTDSVAAALALVGVQLLVVSYCYALYRKVLAANPSR